MEAPRQLPRAPARDRRQRSLRSASLLSILIHVLGVFLFSLRAPECNRPRDPIGSEELDVDLVAPRLAPPVRHQGPADRVGQGEAEREGDEARRAQQGGGRTAPAREREPFQPAASEVSLASLASPAVAERTAAVAERTAAAVAERTAAAPVPSRSTRPTRADAPANGRPAAPRASAPARATLATSERGPEAARDRATPAPSLAPALAPSREGELLTSATSVPPADAARERRASRRRAAEERSAPSEALLRLYREAELPAAPTPTRVLAAVQAEIQERESRKLAALAEQRRRSDAAARKLAALDALARRGGAEAHAATDGVGPGHAGGEGEARSARGGRSGSRYGLRFYLSGRPVKASRVVKPPEAIALPPIRCRVDRIDITPATVRMLVDKAGSVGIAYLLYSSSSRHFDRCAVRHARSIRFRPGHDGAGLPLSVWINVRVEPSLLTAGL